MSYMCLTAHFIDDNWNLHKKIINFCPIAGHSGKLIGRAVEKCLNEWGLKNILTITVGNASANKKAIEHLEMVVKHWGCGVLGGKYLHVRCASHILLFVSSILDPRNKFKYVEWMVRGCYGKQDADILIPKIDCAFRELFKEYSELEGDNALEATSRSSSSSSMSTPMSCDPLQVDTGIDFADFISSQFEMDMGCATSGVKSDLERYLEHALEPRESHFNVLHRWKTNQKRYPTLALIARDLLAIPVSTVASECAFSTGGRVLDSFRTSLTPRMVESLICTQDWLRTSRSPLVLEENILQLEELEEGMLDLLKEQPSIIIDETLDPLDLFDMDFED